MYDFEFWEKAAAKIIGVYDKGHSSGAWFSNKQIRATMAGIVPVFIFLQKASIYTFLDVAFDLVGLVLWGLTTDPSNSGMSLTSVWTSVLQDRGGGNAPNTSWHLLMSWLR